MITLIFGNNSYLTRWISAVFSAYLLVITTPLWGQNIPELGHASDALWSKSTELSLGKSTYERLRMQGQLYESAVDNDYLNYLGNKIAAFAKTRLGLTFYLTRATSINAFATPGGYVGVNAGLVLATDNEHELAGVLAHEIAHVSQEHIARMILAAKNRQTANTAALLAGALVASQSDSDLGTGAIAAILAGETQRQINDIRRHEIEADRVGKQLMQQAGFNSLGMQTFFGKLYTPGSVKNTPVYLLTHPLPESRQAALDTLQQRSKNLHSRDEYYLFRARVRSEFLSQSACQALIKQEKNNNKSAIVDAAWYLSALQALKQGQTEAALQHLAKMKTAMRRNRDVQLLRAKLQILNRQAGQARTSYQRLWKQYHGDNIVAYDYAHFLSQRGEWQTAEKILAKQAETSSNPQMYWLYGKVLQQLGKTVKQQQMLIRFYEQNGQYQQALTQAQIAAKLPQADWQSRAGFEAQQKKFQRLLQQLSDTQ